MQQNMISIFKKILFSSFLFIFINCGSNRIYMQQENTFTENFEDETSFKKKWINNSWKSPATYALEEGRIKFTTRPKSKDRVKIRSKKTFTTGSYTWRILVPEFTLFEQVSVGAFLYHNEKEEFEFDFEIGSGQKVNREIIGIQNNEAIVYCVSQFSPSNSSHFAVKMGEYASFKMELSDVNGFYFVKWYINNTLVKELQTTVKSTIEFKVHCSLENLFFMGDVPSENNNIVYFDSFTYQKRTL